MMAPLPLLDFMRLFPEFRAASWDGWAARCGRPRHASETSRVVPPLSESAPTPVLVSRFARDGPVGSARDVAILSGKGHHTTDEIDELLRRSREVVSAMRELLRRESGWRLAGHSLSQPRYGQPYGTEPVQHGYGRGDHVHGRARLRPFSLGPSLGYGKEWASVRLGAGPGTRNVAEVLRASRDAVAQLEQTIRSAARLSTSEPNGSRMGGIDHE
jgi:hypothetical protein